MGDHRVGGADLHGVPVDCNDTLGVLAGFSAALSL
jgi:hypothetical protein